MNAKRTMVHSVTPPAFTPGVYRHYKGWDYEAFDLACHETDLTWLVLYKPLYPHEGMPDVWARPYDDFMAEIEVEGVKLRRFTYISKA